MSEPTSLPPDPQKSQDAAPLPPLREDELNIPPSALAAFDRARNSRSARTSIMKGPMTLILFGVALLGVFVWFFGDYTNLRESKFKEPKIFDISVDGAVVSQNNFPDVANSVVRVPAGAKVSVTCESTWSVKIVRFEAKLGGAQESSDQCRFTIDAPLKPGDRKPIALAMIERETGEKLDLESLEIVATTPEPMVRITHVIGTEPRASGEEQSLYVTHEAKLLGKVWLMKEPAEAGELVIGILTHRADDPTGWVVAMEGEGQAAKPISATLEPYRKFGEEGRAYYFHTGGLIEFGEKSDANVIYKAVAVVARKADLEMLAARSWQAAREGEPMKARGVTLKEAKALAWNGLLSDDLRLVRLGPGQAAPRPVKWGGT
jgi:hypothetical protein